MIAVNGAIAQTGGTTLTAQTLTTSSVGGQTIDGSVSSFSASNSGSGDISLANTGDLDVTGITQTGGGAVSVGTAGNLSQSGGITADGGNISVSAAEGAITMAAGTETDSNGGDIDYATTGAAGGDITLGTLRACSLCDVGGVSGDVTVTAVGNIFGQAGQTHVTAVTAWLESGADIGIRATPIVFRDISQSGDAGNGAPIHLQAPGEIFVDSGNTRFTSSGSVNDQSAGVTSAVAKALAVGNRQEEEEIDQDAYPDDSTVYEIIDNGVRFQEEQQTNALATLH